MKDISDLGWKPLWAVLERGVLHYFNTRAEAANFNDSRRRDYKYLDSARVTASSENPLSFFIHVSVENEIVDCIRSLNISNTV